MKNATHTSYLQDFQSINMPKILKIPFLITIIIFSLLAFFLVLKSQKKVVFSVQLPIYGVEQSTTAVLVKRGDNFSIKTAQKYLEMRGIPKENIFYIDLPDKNSIAANEFSMVYQKLKENLPDRIQTMVATWQKPYRVDCMSITSALTFGFDKKWCQKQSGVCSTTERSPYFNSSSKMPWRDYQIRPTIMLSGVDMSEVQKLIARGIKADFSFPIHADAYLVKTNDPHRNTRWPVFNSALEHNLSGMVNVNVLDRSNPRYDDYITGKELLLYQTGLSKVPGIDKNQYLPGAIADHLTSFGGQGIGYKGQMKAFRWLEAGATGSYGTVVEPCNFPEKFPNPSVLIDKYTKGETLIEAYWKSVEMPGEGLFIGEPLARPYGVFKIISRGKQFALFTNRLEPHKKYEMYYYNVESEKYIKLERYTLHFNPKRGVFLLQFEGMRSNQYKLEELPMVTP